MVQEVVHQVGRYRFAHALALTLYTGLSLPDAPAPMPGSWRPWKPSHGREPGELLPTTTWPGTHVRHNRTSLSTTHDPAGQRALAISAPNEAVRWYSAALNALPPPRDDLEHARLQLDLGIAQRQAADPN